MKIRLLTILLMSLVLIIQCDKDECPICEEGSSEILKEGLLAYYPFNGNADDESENNHNGIIYGAQFDEDRLNENNALYFDGFDDYVELDYMDSFNSTLESFSLSFWINSTMDVKHYATIMKTINDDAAGTMFSVEIHKGPFSSLNLGVIRLDLRDISDNYFTIYVNRPDIFDNTWHNITFIISSAKNNKGDVFIDGELESKDDYFVRYGSESPEEFESFDYHLTLGAGNNRGTVETYFNGYLDEIAFYNRPLNTNEILQLYRR